MNDDDLERLLLSRSPRFQAQLEESRRSIRSGKGLMHKDFWKAVTQRQRRVRASKGKSESA
jgi:hypothetical protein